MIRTLLAAAVLAATGSAVLAQTAAPVLRASVVVSDELVRIGDVIENAGSAAAIAIYRAPDLGTTGSLPTAQVLEALRSHQVFGVETSDIREVAVTRAARSITKAEIEDAIRRVLERRNGFGQADAISLRFDRDIATIDLDASNTGALHANALRFDPRSNRFDVVFEIANASGNAATRLRFTGIAVETTETAVLTRDVERGDLIKASDITIERRPRAELGKDALSRTQTVGMQARRAMRAGQPLRAADLGKPDLVLRGASVTLVYETAGLYLTIRGKALDNGAEGDTISVLNLQSKREVTGTVTASGVVTLSPLTPRNFAVTRPQRTASARTALLTAE